MKRRFTALTTTVELTVDDELGVSELAGMLIEAYPETCAPPQIAYHLRHDAMVAVDRYEDPVANVADLVPLFELDLYQQVAEHAAPGWLLHAAALERDGRAYVFAGPSGAGKTSLSLALLARGWRILTEEMVLIDRTLRVRGLARPIHTPGDGPQHRAIPPTWRQLEYPIRGVAGAVRHVVTHPTPAERVASSLPLGAIVRIGHAPDSPSVVSELVAHDAIPRLWRCTLRQNDDGLAAAAAIAATARIRELRSGSVEAAVALVERL